jgi:benzodiazapine receptor
MMQPATTQDRIRSVLIIVATIATIVFNSLAGAGYIGGATTGEVSNRYPTILTPAGYAFSIWSLIYAGLIAFSVYQAFTRNLVRFRPVRSLYVITCVLNCAWLYFFHREQMGVCLALITALQITLIVILIQFRRSAEPAGSIVTSGAFGLYAGWVTAAALVNFSIFLVYAGASVSAAGWTAIGIASLIAAAGIAAAVRFSLPNYFFPLAVAWAATAIAVKQSGSTAIVITASICVIACLLMAASYVMNQPEGKQAS